MSGRTRRADAPPDGEPPAKKPLDIAAIRAQIAAKKAAVEAKLAARGGSGSASPAPRDRDRDRDARDRDTRDRDTRDSRPREAPSAPGPAYLPPKPVINDEMSARIAAAKARIDALKNKTNVKSATPLPENPYLAATKAKAAPPPRPSGVALHPLLMEGANAAVGLEKNEKKALSNRYKPMAPKFSTVRANAAAAEEAHKATMKAPGLATAVVTNPYAPTPAPAPGPQGEEIGPSAPGEVHYPQARERKSRKFQFSAAGKYVKQGEQLRNEIKLEELKQRIAAQSRKAGLDSEFDVLERSLKRQPPPAMEWWDEAIMPPGSTYDDIPAAEDYFRSGDSLITHLIQHPIPIPAPSDRKETVRGLMLTKKEQKKMRRQRRQAELEEKRDKQRMGLMPPDPPKVRLANLMKVLTSDAVQDPTKVEAKVRREVALRQFRHEQDNETRKLTPDQRAEKEYAKMAQRESKGLFATAYIIRYLTNGRHIFKVRETAKHDMLSGLCIFHPDFALVLVEGVNKKIKHYRQLMTHRIDWTEEARARGGGGSDSESGSEDEEAKDASAASAPSAPTDAPDGEAAPDAPGPDMAENKCEIVWQGEIPERTFKMFRARHVETDSQGKDWLTQKYEGVWDLAKKWTWADDDL